jgi:hypothetical protein
VIPFPTAEKKWERSGWNVIHGIVLGFVKTDEGKPQKLQVAIKLNIRAGYLQKTWAG